MKVHLLLAQRRGQYPGEYAPEVVVAVDEHFHADHPKYLEDERRKVVDDPGEFSAHAVVTVDLPDSKVAAVLSPRPVEPIATGFRFHADGRP